MLIYLVWCFWCTLILYTVEHHLKLLVFTVRTSPTIFVSRASITSFLWCLHYYKRQICPGWEIFVVPVSQPGTPGRDKRGVLLSRVWQPGQKPFVPVGTNRDKRVLAGAPFVPVGVTNRDKRSFFCFLFSILFLFQLYFFISIKLMYWNLVYMISTNIYIYNYLYNICPR